MIDLLRRLLGAGPSPSDDHAFDREKASFEQNFQQFRHLNEQMNRVPPFAVTLTGGFWYVATIQRFTGTIAPEKEAIARFCLMIFAAITDLMLVFIAIRIRDVMKGYQDKITEFMGRWAPEDRPRSFLWYRDYAMISMYSTMMVAAAVVSVVGAFLLFLPQTGIPFWWAVAGVTLVFVGLIFISNGLPKWLTRRT